MLFLVIEVLIGLVAHRSPLTPRPKFNTDFPYFYTNVDFSTPTLCASAQSMPTIEWLQHIVLYHTNLYLLWQHTYTHLQSLQILQKYGHWIYTPSSKPHTLVLSTYLYRHSKHCTHYLPYHLIYALPTYLYGHCKPCRHCRHCIKFHIEPTYRYCPHTHADIAAISHTTVVV